MSDDGLTWEGPITDAHIARLFDVPLELLQISFGFVPLSRARRSVMRSAYRARRRGRW